MAARSPKEARPPPTKGATERCVVTMAARSPKKRDTSTERQHGDDGCALAEEARQRIKREVLRATEAVTMAARSPKKRDTCAESSALRSSARDDGCALAEEARPAHRRRIRETRRCDDGCALAE